MQLAGRLRRTTLGDLLGTLYRARVHGTLELVEVMGPTAGRAHRIHLRGGQIVALDSGQGGLALLDTTARRGLLEGIEALFRLSDAVIAFRVACPHPRSYPPPLSLADYLHGRPRARDRQARGTPARRMSEPREPDPTASEALTPRARALRLLGLSEGATGEQIRRSFRSLARESHPDRFPQASVAERQRLSTRLSALTEAYHLLVG